MGAVIFVAYFALLGFLTFRHGSYAVLAIICMFALEQWGTIYLSFVAQNGTFVNIAILCLAIFGWFRLPTGTTFEFLLYPIRLMIILLFAYAFISTSWAPRDATSVARFLGQTHYLIIMIFVAPLLIRKSEDITRVLDSLTIFGGLLVILFAYVPDFSGRSLVVSYDLDGAVGLPLALADFAAVVFVVTLVRLKPRPYDIIWTLFVCGSAILLMTKTGSRGQLIFSLAALVICLPVRWRQFTINKFFIYILVAIVVTVVFLIVKNTDNTLGSRLGGITEEAGAVDQRLELITALLSTWSDGSFTTLAFGLGSSASLSESIAGAYPHNVPLEVLGELGLVGFCMLALIIASLTVKAFSRELRANLSNDAARDFAALFGACSLSFLIANKQGAFIDSSNLLLFGVLAEKCVVVGQRSYKHKKQRYRLRQKHRRTRRQQAT